MNQRLARDLRRHGRRRGPIRLLRRLCLSLLLLVPVSLQLLISLRLPLRLSLRSRDQLGIFRALCRPAGRGFGRRPVRSSGSAAIHGGRTAGWFRAGWRCRAGCWRGRRTATAPQRRRGDCRAPFRHASPAQGLASDRSRGCRVRKAPLFSSPGPLSRGGSGGPRPGRRPISAGIRVCRDGPICRCGKGLPARAAPQSRLGRFGIPLGRNLRRKPSAEKSHFEALQKAVDRSPHDPTLLFVLGVCRYFNGQKAAAAPLFRRAAKLLGPLDSDYLTGFLRDLAPKNGAAGPAANGAAVNGAAANGANVPAPAAGAAAFGIPPPPLPADEGPAAAEKEPAEKEPAAHQGAAPAGDPFAGLNRKDFTFDHGR